MNKTKLLSILVITLLIINIGLLSVFFINKPPHLHKKNNPANYVIRELHFDKQQQADYKLLIEEYQGEIKNKEEKIRKLKKELYRDLATKSQSKKDTIINQIGELREGIEHIQFNHFLDVKSLCKENQIDDFNKLTNEIARVFAPHKKKRKN